MALRIALSVFLMKERSMHSRILLTFQFLMKFPETNTVFDLSVDIRK